MLVCDVSPYGVDAVLSHKNSNSQEASTAFAYRTLSNAERNYAQIDIEALAIIFDVNRFHQYIHGRSITIFTDQKPLL